jgi:hypothetical protein
MTRPLSRFGHSGIMQQAAQARERQPQATPPSAPRGHHEGALLTDFVPQDAELD